MFSTLVLYFSTCNNLVNNGNQQERLVDNSNSISEAKKYWLGGFAEGEGSLSSVGIPSGVKVQFQRLSKFILTSDLGLMFNQSLV